MTEATQEKEGFYDALRELIQRLAGPYDQSQFLKEQEEFITHHLDYLFRTHEGGACSHDKTRTIIGRLKRFFENGVEIEFNYNEEYTYHMPKVILKKHEKIMSAYKALECLFYGNPIKYLALIVEIAKDKLDNNTPQPEEETI